MPRYFSIETKSQSGRSVVELIAVLLLIGVLSMAALSGYHWIIDKYRVNVLEDEIMQRTADVKIQLDRPHAVASLAKWDPQSKLGYPIDLDQDEDRARIHVRHVSNHFCHVVTEDLKHLQGVSRLEVDGNSCDKGDNTITFYLTKLETHAIAKPICTCDEPRVCDENGSCVCAPTAPIGHDINTCECPDGLVPIHGRCLCPDESEPIDGVCGDCSSDEECGGGQTCENHICTCVRKECPDSDFTDSLCACCPLDAPKWAEDEGTCKTCAEIDMTTPIYDAKTKTCVACPSETPAWDSAEGVCKTCADIDITLPVYNNETKTCEACPSEASAWDNENKQCVQCVEDLDCAESGFICEGYQCLCAAGTGTPCITNLIQTVKTSVYEQMCYICSCPSNSTMSGDTCVCDNECQTYDVSKKQCVSKTDGTVCTNGLCKAGTCKNDTCPSGTSKTCSSNLVATASSKTAYGTQCYTCSCPSGATLSGSTCICSNECQTYNTSSKTCVNKADGTICSNGMCLAGVCAGDACPSGTLKTCPSNLVATASSKTAYGTQCYTCGCPSGSTLSSDGTTCVCNNECQTYNTSTKTCTNKTNGTTCTNGLCKNGTCTNDTCTSGVKTCSSGYTATKVSTTTYGTACYQCCASPKVWNGSSCACPSNTPQYASTSTCACASGETNQNGVCTPSLYPTCSTYCKNRKSTSSGTFVTCRDTTTTSKLNLKLYLQHTVASNGTKTYTLVSENSYNGQTSKYTYKLGSGSTYFETECEYGYATYNGSYYSLEWTNASSSSLCKGLISGSATCYTSNSQETSNAQKTTCDSFCNSYASRYGW